MTNSNPLIWNKVFHEKLHLCNIAWTGVACPCCNYTHMQQSGDPGILEWTCPNCDYYYDEPDVDA